MAVNKRSQLLQKLKGQRIEIQNLYNVFPAWPGVDFENISPHRVEMSAIANEMLERQVWTAMLGLPH